MFVPALFIGFFWVVIASPILILLLLLALFGFNRRFRPLIAILESKENLNTFKNIQWSTIYDIRALFQLKKKSASLCTVVVRYDRIFLIFEQKPFTIDFLVSIENIIEIENKVWYYISANIIGNSIIERIDRIEFEHGSTYFYYKEKESGKIVSSFLELNIDLKSYLEKTDLLLR